MAEKAVERAHQFEWTNKGAQLLEIYEQTISSKKVNEQLELDSNKVINSVKLAVSASINQ